MYNDTKTTFDRIGDRPLSTKKRIQITLAFALVIVSGLIFAKVEQEFLYTFHKSPAQIEQMKKQAFQKLPNVPEWKIVYVNN
jgi:hypothetical protein